MFDTFITKITFPRVLARHRGTSEALGLERRLYPKPSHDPHFIQESSFSVLLSCFLYQAHRVHKRKLRVSICIREVLLATPADDLVAGGIRCGRRLCNACCLAHRHLNFQKGLPFVQSGSECRESLIGDCGAFLLLGLEGNVRSRIGFGYATTSLSYCCSWADEARSHDWLWARRRNGTCITRFLDVPLRFGPKCAALHHHRYTRFTRRAYGWSTDRCCYGYWAKAGPPFSRFMLSCVFGMYHLSDFIVKDS